MSSGLSTKLDSNNSPELRRVARRLHFACSKLRYSTFQKNNNKDAAQSAFARMHRLVSAFVRNPPKTGFLASRPIIMFKGVIS